MEIDFKCQECGSLLKLKEIKYNEEILKKKVIGIEEDLDKVINHEGKSLISPAETATPGAVDQAASSVEGFISGQIEYSAELLEAAKAEGKLDEFVAAIFDSNDSYQQIDFLNDHLEDCTPDNHKAEIFLQDLKIDNVSLSDIDTTEQLDKAMQIFDTEATKTTLPKLGEGLQPRLIKYPNGKLFYTMVNANSQDINLAL